MMQNPVCKKRATPRPSPTPPQQVLHPQRFSALNAKYALKDGIELNDDCFTGHEGDESDIGYSFNDNGSGDSDNKVHIWLP